MESLTEPNRDGLNPMSDDAEHRAAPTSHLRHTRRLSDKLLIACHHACDTGDLQIAEHLLGIIETILMRHTAHADGNRRRNIEGLVAAHERLWHLRHPMLDQ